jgi:Glycosyltransferase
MTKAGTSPTDANQGETPPIRVLIFYDVPGWAWWHKAQALVRHLPQGFSAQALAFGAPFDPEAYDFILLFGDYMLDMPLPPEKIILGLSCNEPRYVDAVRKAYREGRVRAVFANSEQGRELLGLPQAFCCQNGVDADFFHPPSAWEPGFSVAWVGNPASDGAKGIDLIRAACKACAVPLLTVEHDASKGNLTGIHSQEILRESIYWRASCYICASLYEGTPNPALEALACGVPVISTPVGNMPEVITNGVNGLLAERSADALVKAILHLRAENLAPWREAARQSIMNGWTWPQKAQRYAQMLRELAKGTA